MKSLPTLIKLSKQRVDTQRLRLVKLCDEQDNLKSQVNMMSITLKDEAKRASIDPTMALQYGRYAQDIEGRIVNLRAKINDLQSEIDLNQDRLSSLFQDQKGLEIYKDQLAEKEQLKKDKKAQDELDEITARLHARSKANVKLTQN